MDPGGQGLQRFNHAIVIGGGVAGLLAARSLASHFEIVTVLERDRINENVSPRKGVPQGNHLHLLLLRGAQIIDGFFPGIFDEIEAAGGVVADSTADLAFFLQGQWLPRGFAGLPARLQSRPFLESHLRARLGALRNVRIIGGRRVTGLLPGSRGRDVGGVSFIDDIEGIGGSVEGDFIIDASGRSSRIVGWLGELGYPKPAVSRVTMELAYASRLIEFREPQIAAAFLVYPRPPEQPRGGALYRQECGRWIATLAGYGGEVPPSDEVGFERFARQLATSAIADRLKIARPVSEIRTFRTPDAQWRHFERMSPFPRGIAVVGDAYCSFNPIFGQGMSAAALHAQEISDCLTRGDIHHLGREIQDRVARCSVVPWRISTTLDLAFPTTSGFRYPGLRGVHALLRRLFAAIAQDHELYVQFMKVLHLEEPPSTLISPRNLIKILRAPGDEQCSR